MFSYILPNSYYTEHPQGAPTTLIIWASPRIPWVPCSQDLKALKEASGTPLQHYNLNLCKLVDAPIKYFENHSCIPFINQLNSYIILSFWEMILRLKKAGDLPGPELRTDFILSSWSPRPCQEGKFYAGDCGT